MAIRKRVLTALASIEKKLDYDAREYEPTALTEVLGELSAVRDLCHNGLPPKYSAVYDEVFDGTMLIIGRILSRESQDEPMVVLPHLRDLLREVAANISVEKHFKKEFVFLPYQSSMWDSMESVWQAAMADKERIAVYVVPIPYATRAPEGKAREWRVETNKFPGYVPITDYRDIDLKAMHPDVIIIHNPYDSANNVTSVSSDYYSSELKKCTDRLVYIPYFVFEEFEPGDKYKLRENAKYILLPGVEEADLTFVQSEKIREVYINLLTQGTNKNGRGYWEKRILGLGSPLIDKTLSMKRECISLPRSWRRITEKPNGTRKKVVLYNPSLGDLLHYKGKLFDRMEFVFELFRERRDEVVLLWRPHPLFAETLKSMRPGLLARYSAMVDRYRKEAWGIYDDSSKLNKAVAVSDAYYGGDSSLAELFMQANRLTLRQNIYAFDRVSRSLFSPSSAVLDKSGENIYFLLGNGYSGLYRLNIADGQMTLAALFPDADEENSRQNHSTGVLNTFCPQKYLSLIRLGNYVFLLPWNDSDILRFDLTTEKFSKIPGKLFWHDMPAPLPEKLKIVLATEKNGKLFMVNRDGIVFVYDTLTNEGTAYTWLYESGSGDTAFDETVPIGQRSENCCVAFDKLWVIKGKSSVAAFDLNERQWEEFSPILPSTGKLMKILSYRDLFILIDEYARCFKWHPRRGVISLLAAGGGQNDFGSVSALISGDNLLFRFVSKRKICKTAVADLSGEKFIRDVSPENFVWNDTLVCRRDDGSLLMYEATADAWLIADASFNVQRVCKVRCDADLASDLERVEGITSCMFSLAEYDNFNLTDCLNYLVSVYKFAEIDDNFPSAGEEIKERLLI